MSIIKRFAPIHNETFFSWLHRQSIFYEEFKYPLYLLLDDFERCRRLESFDRDFDFDSLFARGAFNHLSLTRNECTSIFGSPIWLLPEHHRRGFCWDCLQGHVEKVSYPCHLMTWCGVSGTHCGIHFSLLRQHPRSDGSTLNTGLGAFVYFCANKSKYEGDELHQFFSDPLIAKYCLRMANHVENAEKYAGVENVLYLKTYRLLMGVFLIPSYGIVSTILHRRREEPHTANIWQALAYAPMCASITDRALALLLVGIAMCKFSKSESSEILNYLASSRYLDIRFNDVRTLGASCNVFTHESGDVIARALNFSCASLPDTSLQEFLAGFSGRLKRR